MEGIANLGHQFTDETGKSIPRIDRDEPVRPDGHVVGIGIYRPVHGSQENNANGTVLSVEISSHFQKLARFPSPVGAFDQDYGQVIRFGQIGDIRFDNPQTN